MDPRIVEIFPPLGLRVTAGPLELRGIGEPEVLALLDLARRGVVPPGQPPLVLPWTMVPAEEMPLNYLQWWWRSMATWTSDSWELNLCVLWRGEVVGVQGVIARDYPVLRCGETGSWLGLRFQGQGIGTAMRRAMCALLFDHLGFEFIISRALSGNVASLRVSEKLGYRATGSILETTGGQKVLAQRLLLTREEFVRGPEISLQGVRPVRRMLGLED